MIGNRDMIPKNILNVIEETESATSECKELIAQFAISYGGRDEIIRAVKKIIINNTVPEKVDEDFFLPCLIQQEFLNLTL